MDDGRVAGDNIGAVTGLLLGCWVSGDHEHMAQHSLDLEVDKHVEKVEHVSTVSSK